MKRFLTLTLAVLVVPFLKADGQAPAVMNTGQIKLALSKMNTLGTVLYIAAHPDDENTRLLSYFANERKFRSVYLSLTRGDGGQNLIGKEQGSELGMIRTRELLAARNVDGAEQYFTRANDFGFSKNPEETFSIWKKEDLLSDVVWAIRYFKPDVIINRFPTTGEGGHGHHTASALLSLEAFTAAADPLRFPEQLKYVDVWQAKRVFLNSFIPRGQTPTNFEGQLKQDVGTYNPLLGSSYGEIAAESRSMHKSQGFGVPKSRGVLIEYFKKQAGDTVVNELFEGIDTTWARVKGGNDIENLLTEAQNKFSPEHPEQTIPLLIASLKKIKLLQNSYWKSYKENEIKKLITACAGLWFEANPGNYFSTPGDTMGVAVSAISRMSSQIKIESISFPGFDSTLNKELLKNDFYTFNSILKISDQSEYTIPYWLRQPHRNDSYTILNPEKRGEPWNSDEMKVKFTFVIEGEIISYEVPFRYKFTDPVKGELYRPFEILPAASVTPSDEVVLFSDNNPKKIQIKVKSFSDSLSGKLGFNLSPGFVVTPASLDVSIAGKGKEATFEFTIKKQSDKTEQQSAENSLKVFLEVNGKTYTQSVRRIEYDHIPPMVDLRLCEIKLVSLQLKSVIKKIGYLEGAGDEVAKCLHQAGFDVTILKETDILNGPLSQYGAIITGIRAYNTIENIDQYYTPLMNYVEAGGNLIVQYNTNNFLSTVKANMGPYPFKISRDRVTVESAPVTFINPSHPLLNSPNKITAADFDNWVQERGLYFATEISPEYETILSWNDPGEKPLNGALIFAKKGKGNFIYTGISFFRQLPAGVPGSYRLITNLINASK